MGRFSWIIPKCPWVNPIILCVLVDGSKWQLDFGEEDCKYLKGGDRDRAACKAVSLCRRAEEGFSLGPPEEQLCQHLGHGPLRLQLRFQQRNRQIKVCSFKTLCLWYFVTTESWYSTTLRSLNGSVQCSSSSIKTSDDSRRGWVRTDMSGLLSQVVPSEP